MANYNPDTKSYPLPLDGYRENQEPLTNDFSADGKSYINKQTGILSKSYDRYEDPITNSQRGGWDIHIYFHLEDEFEHKYAKELWERVRREFPELRIYRFWEKPIGPHPLPMFEVNVFNPHQFGAFVSWFAVHRGPLGALVHPNTDDEHWDHTKGAIWFGEVLKLKLDILAPPRKALDV